MIPLVTNCFLKLYILQYESTKLGNMVFDPNTKGAEVATMPHDLTLFEFRPKTKTEREEFRFPNNPTL